MKYGVCHLSVVPCRLEPFDSSEMVTQLLFGETVKIYEERKSNDWVKIKTAYDNYECWVDRKQYVEITKEEFTKINSSPTFVCANVADIVKNNFDESFSPIVLGSSLPNYSETNLHLADTNYTFEGDTFDTTVLLPKVNLAENSYLYMNTPYLWGGRSPFGIDCSGFTQVIYKLNGFKLPRDASQQAEIGETLSFVEESESGDLAFFDNEEGNIIHVGIILSENRIIHASGKIRIDKIDHQGIFNIDTGKYTHRLRLIKKII